MINTEITKATKANLNNIDTLLSAVFGNKVSQDEIPKSMRKANVKNPALAVFGGGRWLMDNPTQDLASHWTAVGKLMVSLEFPLMLLLLTIEIEARYRLATGESL